MAALSDELERLFQLHERGVLSVEEFASAKQAAIAKSMAAATSAAPVLAPQQGQSTSAYEAALAVGTVDVGDFQESAYGANSKVYAHLRTILNNLRRFPTDPKYRKLRLDNPVLAAELFVSAGALTFLQSLGFELFSTTDELSVARARTFLPGVTITVGEGEILLLPTPLSPSLLAEAEKQLQKLEERDVVAQRNAMEYTVVRRSIGMQLRREQCVQAVQANRLIPYIEKELLRNHPANALEAISLVLKAIGNILANPEERKFRHLPAHNQNVQVLLNTFGILEFLLYVAGFELSDEGLLLPDALDLSRLISAESEARQLEQFVSKHIEEDRRRALTETELEAEAARRRAMKELHAKQGIAEASASASPPQPHSGKRVPLSEALQILLGKKRSYSPDEVE